MGKTDLYRVQKPVIVERFFTDSEARLMQSKGIDIRKCN